MQLNQSLEALLETINALDRNGCVDELKHMPYLKLDFTEEYLAQQNLERLRHLVMAATLQARRHVKQAG